MILPSLSVSAMTCMGISMLNPESITDLSPNAATSLLCKHMFDFLYNSKHAFVCKEPILSKKELDDALDVVP